MSSPSRRILALAAFVALLATFVLLRPKRPPEIASHPAEAPASPSSAPIEPAARERLIPAMRPSAVQGLAQHSLLPDGTSSVEENFRARMAETRVALLEKTRYPLDSRPLATKTDLLLPHHVDPLTRGLGKEGHVTITQQQDRVWVAPGQPAIVSVTAKTDGTTPATVNFASADLVRHLDGQPDQVMGQVAFADNGVAPDEIASDGTYTGTVSTPTDGTGASLTLVVNAQAGGEAGTLLFEFVQTASAPATFTQTARDALEQGSVAIYVGIQVQRAGTYEIQGRLYDSTGMPLVYMRFLGALDPSSTEVRLYAFGKVILDEGGVPPFVLRDVEGWRMTFGEYPDRELMTDWPAGYTTAKYDLSQISSAEYNGPDKQQKLSALANAEAEGISNIRSGAAAAAPAPH